MDTKVVTKIGREDRLIDHPLGRILGLVRVRMSTKEAGKVVHEHTSHMTTKVAIYKETSPPGTLSRATTMTLYALGVVEKATMQIIAPTLRNREYSQLR